MIILSLVLLYVSYIRNRYRNSPKSDYSDFYFNRTQDTLLVKVPH